MSRYRIRAFPGGGDACRGERDRTAASHGTSNVREIHNSGFTPSYVRQLAKDPCEFSVSTEHKRGQVS